mgnify:CR=1 FL=1
MSFKKVLVLMHPELDYLAESVLVGLYETPELEVIEYPYCFHMHGGIDDWYVQDNRQPGFTAPAGYMADVPLPPNEKSLEEILDRFREIDLFILSSGRSYAIRGLQEICKRLNKKPDDLNLIFCDGEDSPDINIEAISHYRPKVYFKRELLAPHVKPTFTKIKAGDFWTPIFALPFSAFTRGLPEINDQEKDWDVCLALGMTWPARQNLLAKFLEAGAPRSYICVNGDNPLRWEHPFGNRLRDMMGWTEYMTKMGRSKLTAVMRGWGRDTLHAYEAFCYETLVLWCDPGIRVPFPFIPNQHCIEFTEDCEDVKRLIRYYLDPAHEAERLQIAKAGKAHLYKYHTTQKRAEYMLSVSERILNGEEVDWEEFGL